MGLGVALGGKGIGEQRLWERKRSCYLAFVCCAEGKPYRPSVGAYGHRRSWRRPAATAGVVSAYRASRGGRAPAMASPGKPEGAF